MTKKIADLKPGTRFTYGKHNCMVLDHLEQGTLCMVATCQVKCNSKLEKISEGEFQLRHLRGR